jgi:hypothetical protein
MEQTQQLKNLVAQIDIAQIISYLQETTPKSKILKRTVGCYKKVQDSNDAVEVFKRTVQLAYCLDTLANKTPYPKSEVDKKK